MMAKHLKISGRVQSVGYRYFLTRAAHELGITGWVRNRRDGSVEAVVAGTSEAVNTLIGQARRGPPHAMVTDLRVSEADGSFERFDVLPTE
jgi:acylphosphatase